MRRWIWSVLLTVAVMAALAVGASAETVVYPETGSNSIRYDLDTGTVLGPVEANRSSIKKAEIQAEVGGKAITAIDGSAFRNCKQLESVTIPRTVTSLGTLVFSGCDGLKTVELSDKLTLIPDGTFYNCGRLTSIAIPEGVTKIGQSAFFGSGLTQVTIPAKVQTIDEEAFAECANLGSVIFQDNVSGGELSASVSPTTDIKAKAFSNCGKLDKLTLSGSVKSIGDNAFSSCVLLKKVVVHDGTTEIGKEAFSGCPLTDLVIFEKNVQIKEGAFLTSSLKTVHFVSEDRPTDWEEETVKLVHQISTQRTVRASTSCTSTGSVRDSFSCKEAGCKYAYSEPAREVPAIPHTLAEKNPRKAPTCTETGQLAQQGCTICSYVEKRVSLPALGHDPVDTDDRSEIKKATCAAEGTLKIVTKRCQRPGCGEELASKTEPIPKLAHTYDTTGAPEYNKAHVLIPSTCETAGLKVIDQVCTKCGFIKDPTAECADCKNYLDLKEPTKEQTEAYITHVKGVHSGQEMSFSGHDWGEWGYDYRAEADKPTCAAKGTLTAVRVCKVCDKKEWDDTKTKEGDETLPHTKPDDWAEEVLVEGDCVTRKKTKLPGYECQVCHQDIPEEIVEGEDPSGEHKYENLDEEPVKDATCKETGLKKVGAKKCTVCGHEVAAQEEIIPKKAHAWGTPVKDENPGEGKEDKAPTCGEEGVEYVVVSCQNKFEDGTLCGETEHRAITLPATGEHKWGKWETKEPTLTQAGEKKRVCENCGKEDKIVLPATGDTSDPEDPGNPDKPTDPDKPSEPEKPKTYQVNIVQGAGGTASASKTTAQAGDKVTVTLSPESGYELDMIRAIGGGTSVVSLTDLGGGRYQFTMPEASVEIRATFSRKSSGPSWANAPGEGTSGDPRRTTDVMPTQNPTQSVPRAGAYEQLFRDIPTSHWAAGEINWANQMGYMNGSGGRFNPDGNISHQQMWMVLARLTGNHPANMTEARRWAVEHSFADGSSPTGEVQRHQLVTALYRSAHLMGSTNRYTTSLAGYADSRTVPAVARDAFAWAVANGILGGTANGRLDPNGTLTRAQFAVILYRYSQKI